MNDSLYHHMLGESIKLDQQAIIPLKETLINSFAVIPANAGIQLPVELNALDSGSPRCYARNDELFRTSLSIGEVFHLYIHGKLNCI